MNKGKTVEIKLEKNRIIIEQMNKQMVNSLNFNQKNEEFYNFAIFEVIDREKIRYYPFNNKKYLSYDEKLPPITHKSAILPTEQGMKALNDFLASRRWRVWGQDEEKIAKELGEIS